jgi:heptosyltransferase-2/heptosyltransferase-3
LGREALRLLGLRALGRLAPGPPTGLRPRRLLLIRPDHLGDLLLTTPAIAALRQSLPEAHLTLLAGPWSEAVARRGPPVDEILTLEFPGFTRRPKRDPFEPYRLLSNAARRLRGRYDLAVILRPDHWWGALLAAGAGIGLRLGYRTPSTTPLLSIAIPLPLEAHSAALSLRLAERAAALAGGQPEPFAQPPPPLFRITEDERAWASHQRTERGQPLVVLHPGSGAPLKSWPAPRWAAVADGLADQGAAVLLTGGPDDLDSPLLIESIMRRPAGQLAGQTSFGQLAALFERASLVVGVDSGPLHLAAAVGAPTLRLYGPTDPARYGPWAPAQPGLHPTLFGDLPCRPCGDLVAPPCGAHQDPACLAAVQPPAVIEAALRLLGAGLTRSAASGS